MLSLRCTCPFRRACVTPGNSLLTFKGVFPSQDCSLPAQKSLPAHPSHAAASATAATGSRALTPGVPRSSWWTIAGWLTTTTRAHSTLKQNSGPGTSASQRSRVRWCLHGGGRRSALSGPCRAAFRAGSCLPFWEQRSVRRMGGGNAPFCRQTTRLSAIALVSGRSPRVRDSLGVTHDPCCTGRAG